MYAIAFASSLTIDVTELLHVGHIKFTGFVPNGGTETTKQQCFNIIINAFLGEKSSILAYIVNYTFSTYI